MSDEGKEFSEITTPNLRNRYLDAQGASIRRIWRIHNESVQSYERSFGAVLEGRTLNDLISSRLVPIVIDLMAPPRTVHDLLLPFHDGRGLAVSLPDHNLKDVREDLREIYKMDKIKWLPEDITHPGTWRNIEQWLDGNKAHLIMERGMAGLEWLPLDKRLFKVLFDKAWHLLDPNGGILLFETPRSNQLLRKGVDIDAWVKSLHGLVDVKYDPGNIAGSDPRFESGKIMITRNPNSPESLPSI